MICYGIYDISKDCQILNYQGFDVKKKHNILYNILYNMLHNILSFLRYSEKVSCI